MSIRILPSEVSSKIAAGEVVERPASVVKELVENSLDAGATHIAVEVFNGGLGMIRVVDNGCGIPADEAELAFHRHATSKLSLAEDLARISTLGFRGEALPSIAAVAQVEMITRPQTQTSALYMRLIDGAIVTRSQRGASPGTSITVRYLFAKQPARRRFLRSPTAEASYIANVVAHYALAYPQVYFSLRTDGRRGLQTPGNGQLRDTVATVYGSDVAAALLEISPPVNGDGQHPPFLVVEGLVSPPSLSRASRQHISIFVNGRWIQNRSLTYAVESAYEGLLMTGRHPIAIVHLRLPPEEVDINVHPTKAEIRFRQERDAFAGVQRQVRSAVLGQAPIPSLSVDRQPVPAISVAIPSRVARSQERPASAVSVPAADRASQPLPVQSLPMLRVVGQVDNTYVVAEGPDGLYLIDQHTAHERILYERFKLQREQHQIPTQGLLEPLVLELSPHQLQSVASYAEALAEHGFVLEEFGSKSYLLRAVPASVNGDDVRQRVLDFLEILNSNLGAVDARDRVAMSLACHGAVRAGQTLSIEEMRELVHLLEQTQAPHTCPHGRPTMVHMSKTVLEREFHRR